MTKTQKADRLSKAYKVEIMPDPDRGHWAVVKELPYCLAWGSTMSDAKTSLRNLVLSWLTRALEEGKDIPPPT